MTESGLTMSGLTDEELEKKLAGLSPVKRRLALARLKKRSAQATAPKVETIPRVSRGEDLPLSSAQERLWFLDQAQPGSPFYNIPLTQRLKGDLRLDILRQVIAALVRRHESLRTGFPSRAGKPAQRIAPPEVDLLEVIDLTSIPYAETVALGLAAAEAGRSFDLSEPPLARFTLLRLAADDHVLLLTLHHIIADGWSLGVLIQDVGSLYRAFAAGETPSLPPLPIQTADFAAWQQAKIDRGVLEKQLGWWKERLVDLPDLEFPTDLPRSDTPTYRGRREAFPVPARLTAALATVQQEREGVTLFMVLLAGFQALLGRLTGLDDSVVGSAIANRNRRELEGLIGFFVNTLVMRTDLAGDPSFEELLNRVRGTALGAFENQDVPFERLVEVLQPERRWGRNPFFQVMFAVQNAPRSTLELPDLTLLPFGTEGETSKFDLQVDFWEQGEDLVSVFQYDTSLFHRTTIARLAGQLWTLLEAALAAPQAPLSHHALLSSAERQQLCREWNDTASAWPRELLHELVTQIARERPDSVALEQDGEVLRYGELEAASNRLAHLILHHLPERGVGEEVLVGLLLERSLEMLVATLAILKAGAAYLPLDPAYPAERLAFMLSDTESPLVITRGDLRERLPAAAQLHHDVAILDLAAEEEALAAASSLAPYTARGLGGAEGERLAYVMYTSGSTGRPKGVAVPHRAVVRLVCDTNFARFGPEEVFFQFAPISFDAATFEIWGSLIHGARLVVMTPGKVSTEDLGQVIEESGVTTLWLTAALFQQMVQLAPQRLAGVRQLLAGGDVLPVTAVETVLRELPNTRLINGYGPTENTTFTCCHPILPGSRVRPSVPIGRPIRATRAHVLDRTLTPLPIGIPGDLFAAGFGLARGYLGRPGLTAERFVPDPLATEPGSRLYATGDRVRHLGDGLLEFLGRQDHQVKVRGFRVEIGEVETALLEHPLVREAAVVLEADERGGQRLVAFAVADRSAVDLQGGDGGGDESAEAARQQVDRWESLFEDTYKDGATEEPVSEGVVDIAPGFDISGWNSSYTGQAIPAQEMREWLDDTVDSILGARVDPPRRVLEIGCGTGLLLFQLLPHVERYVATDFSSQALASIRRQAQADGVALDAVELRESLADDFSDLEEASFDAVIINSVIQYFPSIHYLEEVVAGALRTLAPGGVLFVGDVRTEPLLENLPRFGGVLSGAGGFVPGGSGAAGGIGPCAGDRTHRGSRLL